MKEIVMGLALGLAAGFVCGGTVVGSLFQNDAIKQNCAEYDSQNGKWTWKSHVEITPDITAQYDNQFLEANCPSYSVCVNQGGSPAHLKDLGDCSISCAMTLADGSLYFWFYQK